MLYDIIYKDSCWNSSAAAPHDTDSVIQSMNVGWSEG